MLVKSILNIKRCIKLRFGCAGTSSQCMHFMLSSGCGYASCGVWWFLRKTL